MLFSIIIPVFNNEKTLDRTLDILMDNKTKEVEFIVVNDGSTDNTVNVLKKYNNIRIITNKKALGMGESKNRGIQIAEGEYISFVNADDIYYIDTALNLINDMKKNEAEIGLASYMGYDFKLKDADITVKEAYSTTWDNNEIIEKRNVFNKTFNCGYNCWNKIFKKNYLEKANIYFPKLTYAEDLLFTRKALLNCNKILLTNKILVMHTIPTTNQQSNDIRYLKNWNDLFVAEEELWFELKKIYNKIDHDIFNMLINDYIFDCIRNVKYTGNNFSEINSEFNKEALSFICKKEEECRKL